MSSAGLFSASAASLGTPLALVQAVKSTAAAELHVYGDWYLGDPRFLAFAPLALLALAWGRGRRGRVAARVPWGGAAHLPSSWRQRIAFVPRVAALLASLLVSVALARPLRANVLETTTSEGVDIALVVDRSSSMTHPDMARDETRLEVVKRVVGEFARRRTSGADGAADSIALVTFARYPELVCPFTLDGEAVVGFLDGVEHATDEIEDGTAIGLGLAKAVALLRETDAKSKICVLLTDGENNVDDIRPLDAATLAAEEGIRVYTILAGRYVFMRDLFGRIVPSDRELDTTVLEEIAELTGARFYRARDRAALEEVYGEIEALEKTERSREEHVETFDLYPRFLLPALGLYLFAWLSFATWARRLA